LLKILSFVLTIVHMMQFERDLARLKEKSVTVERVTVMT
jgi:hypothetical protein